MPKWIFASNDFSFPIGWVLLRETISAGPLSSKLQASGERAISRPDAQKTLFMRLLLVYRRNYFQSPRKAQDVPSAATNTGHGFHEFHEIYIGSVKFV